MTRCDYGSTSLVVGGKPGSVSENLGLLASALMHGFVYAGILLAIAGVWWAWRNRRAEGIALFTAFFVAGPLFQIYTRTSYPDELTKGVVARFYILPSLPLAILAGLGAWWMLGQAEHVSVSRRGLVTALAAVALLVVPVASAADHYSSDDQTGNYVAQNYGKDLLGLLKPNALLIMHADENLTSIGVFPVRRTSPAGRGRGRQRAPEDVELCRADSPRAPGDPRSRSPPTTAASTRR